MRGLLVSSLLVLVLVLSSQAEGWVHFAKHSHSEAILADAIEHGMQGAAKAQVEEGLRTIRKLADELRDEEIKLQGLIVARETFKTGWFWFFDNKVVLRLDEAQLTINDQERIVENKFEDILFHWKQLKPLFGVRSAVFFSEVFTSFFSFIPMIFRSLFGFAEFTLISFLFFGPIVFATWALFTSIGLRLIPIVLSVYWITWVARLPFLIIQYNPTPLEFGLIYGFAVLIATASTWLVLRPLRTRMTRIKLD